MLWELLIRKNVNAPVITTDDLKRYDYLTVDQRSFAAIRTRGKLQNSRGPKFREVISKLFLSDQAASRSRSCVTASLGVVLTFGNMAGKLYFDSERLLDLEVAASYSER